jgi:uncharacterized membrane protein YgcG
MVLIFYGADEKTTACGRAVTDLAEKDWRNVFMLTGGLAGFEEQYPAFIWPEPAEAKKASPGKRGSLSPRATLARDQGVKLGRGGGSSSSSSYGGSFGGSPSVASSRR